jgi:hypothetical protein
MRGQVRTARTGGGQAPGILDRIQLTGVRCANGHPLEEPGDLSVEQRSPCPECGSTGRRFEMAGTATVKMVASLQWEKRHQFWERNWLLLVVAAVVTVASPLVGVVVAGVVGAIVGLALGIISTAAGAFALVRVREITRGGA